MKTLMPPSGPRFFSRRQFSSACTGLALACGLGNTSYASARSNADNSAPRSNKRLIILEMQGGNDGLNTVIPWRDPLYRHYRPTLGLADEEMIRLSDDVALNSALPAVANLYEQGQLALIQDVGYAHPNLSHFESAAIWAAGRTEEIRGSGWIARVIAANRNALDQHALDADGIVLGGNTDPLAGAGVHVLAIDDVRSFLNAAPNPAAHLSSSRLAARHLVEVLEDTRTISTRLRAKLTGPNRFQAALARADNYVDPFNSQISNLLWMMDSGATSLVYKLALPGFDMHTDLRGQHEQLLARLDQGIASLVGGLKQIGLWQDTLILVHSEFGRRPAENASHGTDHGSAGPALLIGGGFSGGIYGKRADLSALDADGNPIATSDFRSIYSTIVNKFWQLKADPVAAHLPLLPLHFA